MADICITAALRADVDILAPRLCAADKLELELALGSVKPAFAATFTASVRAYTIMVNHQPYVMCGLMPLPNPRHAALWCLSCEDARRFPLRYMRYGRMLVQEGLANFTVLENYVHANNLKSLAWLKRLGARFEAPRPYGVKNALFYKFTITAKDPHDPHKIA